MGKRAGLARWFGFGWGRRHALEGPDFGDMGTAFGLDASLAGDTDIGPEAPGADADADMPMCPADRLKRRSAF